MDEKNFDLNCGVSWLIKEPLSSAEIAENIYERVRSIGIWPSATRAQFIDSVRQTRNDLDSVTRELQSSCFHGNWTAEFLESDIDRYDIGTAAIVRANKERKNP